MIQEPSSHSFIHIRLRRFNISFFLLFFHSFILSSAPFSISFIYPPHHHSTCGYSVVSFVSFIHHLFCFVPPERTQQRKKSPSPFDFSLNFFFLIKSLTHIPQQIRIPTPHSNSYPNGTTLRAQPGYPPYPIANAAHPHVEEAHLPRHDPVRDSRGWQRPQAHPTRYLLANRLDIRRAITSPALHAGPTLSHDHPCGQGREVTLPPQRRTPPAPSSPPSSSS